MASVHDVAAYILEQRGPMSTMKLQKLVYYSQAWHLVWDEEPLFDSRIEAWVNGPVVPELFRRHKGEFQVSSWTEGDSAELTPSQRESVDIVLDEYGAKSGQWLAELTHLEGPWLEAREGLPKGAYSSTEIPLTSMQAYYEGLL